MNKDQRAAINRQNAAKSTGPRTQAGKDIAKYNSFKRGLDSSRPLHVGCELEAQVLIDYKKTYEDEFQPATLDEIEAVNALAETQWQLVRVRRLLDLSFSDGGDLMKTSRMMDNFSRHQTRAQKLHDGHRARLDVLLAKREAELTPSRGANRQVARETEAEPTEASSEALKSPTAAGPTAINQPKTSALQANGFVPHATPQPKTNGPAEPKTDGKKDAA